jgi:phage gpG-like protein
LRSKGRTTFEFGTKGISYAGFVNNGTRKMPARPYLDFGKEIEPKLKSALEKGLKAAAKAGQADEFFGGI